LAFYSKVYFVNLAAIETEDLSRNDDSEFVDGMAEPGSHHRG